MSRMKNSRYDRERRNYERYFGEEASTSGLILDPRVRNPGWATEGKGGHTVEKGKL